MKHLYIIFLFGLLVLCFPQLSIAQVRKAISIAALNSDFDELMPVLAPNGKTLYFVRTGHPNNTGGEKAGQDIWFSQVEEATGNWQEPQNIGPPLNNIHNNAITYLSTDGSVAWLSNIYKPKNRMAPGLSFSIKRSTGWTKPEAVLIRSFYPDIESINFYQATDSILLLSMQTDTARREDIFICRRVGAKEWSAPVNIGATINTSGFEIAPFVAPDRRTLYFASNGHGGFGNADIFRSKRLDDSWLHWSEPENLGKEVNSNGFDGYFTLDAAGERAYFTSQDKEKEDTDIYSIRVEDIVPSGEIVAAVPARGSSIAEPNTKSSPEEDNLMIAEPIKATLVYFDVNSAKLKPEAQAALQNLLFQLREKKSSNLLISGHADDTGSEPSNKILSEERAKAVAIYLTKQGLKQINVSTIGYGSHQPLAPNSSPANRGQNRRVEIKAK